MPIPQTVPTIRTLLVRPIGGQNNFNPPEELSLNDSPDMSNCSVVAGYLRKRPGYTQYGSTTLDGAVCGLFSTQDAENNTHLYAVTASSVYKYDTATQTWIHQTGAALGGGGGMVVFENSQDSVIFCDGVYRVQRVDFALASYAQLSANCPPARTLTRFANRVYIGYTTEGGVTKPYRIRRSVAGDHTDWTGVGSGFTDLDEFPYQIRMLRKLGAQMAVMTEQSINMATRTEIAAAPARFDIQVPDIGLWAAHTLTGWGDLLLFLGNDDFYAFNASNLEALMQPTRDTLFGNMNPGALLKMFGLVRFDTQEYLGFICTGSNIVPDTVWAWNRQRRIWYPWTVSGPKCGCSHRLDDTTTIDSLVGTIDAQNWEFDTRALQSQYRAMLTGHSDAKVYLWSTQYKSDNGVLFTSYWMSKDFTARDIDPSFSNNKVTLKTILVSYLDIGADFSLDFQYSTDGGATWTSADTIAFSTAGGTTRRLDKLISHQATGNSVRFRFSQASLTQAFVIASFHVELEALSAPLYS